jgi:hypothetical protein
MSLKACEIDPMLSSHKPREIKKISIDNLVVDMSEVLPSSDMNDCVTQLLRKDKKRNNQEQQRKVLRYAALAGKERPKLRRNRKNK